MHAPNGNKKGTRERIPSITLIKIKIKINFIFFRLLVQGGNIRGAAADPLAHMADDSWTCWRCFLFGRDGGAFDGESYWILAYSNVECRVETCTYCDTWHSQPKLIVLTPTQNAVEIFLLFFCFIKNDLLFRKWSKNIHIFSDLNYIGKAHVEVGECRWRGEKSAKGKRKVYLQPFDHCWFHRSWF